MKTKIILTTVVVALMAAALVGVTAAQFANQTPFTTTVNRQVEPPCVTGDISAVPPYCINSTTGEPYCYENGTYAGSGDCLTGAGDGYYQNGYCHGYGYGCGQEEQYQHRYSGVGGNGYGFGDCGHFR
ncbi:MAG: hypothetical protein ACQCN6_06040 [Candidatus Bathyarchaeia archaeon]|jgi:hypothetical protein